MLLLPLQLLSKAKGSIKNNPLVLIIILVVVLLLFRVTIQKIRDRIRQNAFDKNEGKDVNNLAQQYRGAVNPSGYGWMIEFDGSDEAAIERLAYQTKGVFQLVADVYKLKFDESLSDRLRKELNSQDYQNWRNIVT